MLLFLYGFVLLCEREDYKTFMKRVFAPDHEIQLKAQSRKQKVRMAFFALSLELSALSYIQYILFLSR